MFKKHVLLKVMAYLMVYVGYQIFYKYKITDIYFLVFYKLYYVKNIILI